MKKSIFALLLLSIIITLPACAKEAPVETSAVTEAPTVPPETTAEATVPTTEALPEHFTLTFAGDCTLGSHPANFYAPLGFIQTVGEDYDYPFRNVRSIFERDEFTMVNLEGPLLDEGRPQPRRHNFHGPRAFVQILTGSSVEAVTIANNHALDYGEEGMDSTKATLDDAGIPWVERDKTCIVTTKNGLRIGLYAMVYYKLDLENMAAGIEELKQQNVDLIIVAPHWGVEYTYAPTPEQVKAGHAAIDAGADFVYGTHPHVLQPIEYYGGGIICYSLGNFSFGGNGNPKDHDTVILQLEVIREPDGTVHLGELTPIPASISSEPRFNNYQPTPLEPGSEGYDRVLEKLQPEIS